MVKIAWCLSGQPRHLSKGNKCIKEYIRTNNVEVDFFCHGWYNETNIISKAPWATIREGNSNIRKKDIDNVLKLYNPKSYLFEEEMNFSSKEFENSLMYNNTKNDKCFLNMSNCFSCQNSRQKCMNLLINYENDNNLNYDIIFFSRYDFCNNIKLKMNEIDINKIYTRNTHYLNNRYLMDTALIVGSAENMKKLYKNIFDNIIKYKDNKSMGKLIYDNCKSQMKINDEEIFMGNFFYNNYKVSDIYFTKKIPSFY